MIWSLIVGGILGWLASLITGKDVPGGVIGNIIAGIIGSGLVRNYLVVLVQSLADMQLFQL